MKPKVLITRDLPAIAYQLLEGRCELVTNPEDVVFDRQTLIEKARDCEAVLCSLSDTIDGPLMDALPGVKIFANCAVGYDNIDVAAAKERGVLVTNTPGVLSDTTAETAWALLFAASRRIVEADRFARSGEWKSFHYKDFLGQDVYGKTLGVIGAGRIGQRFCEKSRGYHMPILYHNRTRDLDFEKRFNAEFVSLEELMKQSDFVSVHVPLTEETHHLIDGTALSLMKPTAVLVNTSRGPVIDEAALAQALAAGKLFAAGLDVYEKEPEIHPELLKLQNVVLLPHIGSASVETRDRMAEMAAKNVLAALEGKEPPNLID
jgi:lactate dehydrogenase-like 2-hydroxyacid dehydrogenase